jgi:hypothetical protein
VPPEIRAYINQRDVYCGFFNEVFPEMYKYIPPKTITREI